MALDSPLAEYFANEKCNIVLIKIATGENTISGNSPNIESLTVHGEEDNSSVEYLPDHPA